MADDLEVMRTGLKPLDMMNWRWMGWRRVIAVSSREENRKSLSMTATGLADWNCGKIWGDIKG